MNRLASLFITLFISVVAVTANETPECVINKSRIEGGDTLTLTMPNIIFGNGASALRIDIIDNETGQQLLTAPFAVAKGDSTTVNIELPSCGIRNHDDIIDFFSCLTASNDYLYADTHKPVYLLTDWPAKYDFYMEHLNLKKIPVQHITYLSFLPDGYSPKYCEQRWENGKCCLEAMTDKSFPVNDTFAVNVLDGDEQIMSFDINIHKIYYRQYGVNGKMIKAASPLLLKIDTEHFDDRP